MVLIVVLVWVTLIEESVDILQKLVNHFDQAEAVLVPEWFNGVDCKSIIHRFESDPALNECVARSGNGGRL